LRYDDEQDIMIRHHFRRRRMIGKIFSNLRRKDIEFHEYRFNSDGNPTGVIQAKPISILYDGDEIDEEEISNIVDSHRYDLSHCLCDDERMVVVTTAMADRLSRIIAHRNAG
jgi:hypothetical protein